jgi:hypothetical protein
MAQAIGIRLGYRYAVAAIKLDGGVRVLQNKENVESTASIPNWFRRLMPTALRKRRVFWTP